MNKTFIMTVVAGAVSIALGNILYNKLVAAKVV